MGGGELFGVELDIRTLAFIATLAAFVQAITFVSLWMVSRHRSSTLLWAIGGISTATGFVLLGYRGVLPDFASIIIANTLIALSHVFYWLGLEGYTERKPSIWLSGITITAVVLLFFYFSQVSPDIPARVIVISTVLALLSFGCVQTLWLQDTAKNSAPEHIMAITFLAHGLFHMLRAVYTWLDGQQITSFMNAPTVHMFAFLDIILFQLLTAVGFTAMIIIGLNSSLRAEAKSKNRLFAILAHDLRSPFNGLAGLSMLAQQDIAKGNHDEARSKIQMLHSSASETLRFLDDLLIWGRTLIDDRKTEPSTISLDELIEGAVKVAHPLLQAKSIAVDYAPQKLIGFGIAQHAEMICRNLLVNAIKFSKKNSTIKVRTQIADTKVKIQIIDQGAGVTDQMIADFATSSGSQTSTEGTSGELGAGVGLSLCRDLCREDGEQIWLEHNPQGGLIATFTVTALRDENTA